MHVQSIAIYANDDDDRPSNQQPLLSFFMGLANNQSITDLSLDQFIFSHMDIDCTTIFEVLEFIFLYGQLSEGVPSLISALKRAHGLQYIDISYNKLEDSFAADIINGIRSMPGLHNTQSIGTWFGEQHDWTAGVRSALQTIDTSCLQYSMPQHPRQSSRRCLHGHPKQWLGYQHIYQVNFYQQSTVCNHIRLGHLLCSLFQFCLLCRKG